MTEHIKSIQEVLRQEGLDGWLFFDHHERDPLAYRVLRFKAQRPPTRRWYYMIPAQGEPRAMVHRIERFMLDALPGSKRPYSSWTEQREGIAELVKGARKVAMQYSPMCAVPYVAMVDAGTVELVRSTGVEVVGSENLIQHFEARWSAEQLESHLEAGRRVDAARQAAFEFIAERHRAGETVTEYDVLRFVQKRFQESGLYADHGPIVAVNANASNPHYEPTEEWHQAIGAGDLVLLDMWAKLETPDSVYYDITWTGYCGATPPVEMENIFTIVKGARDAAIARVKLASDKKEALRGFEVDDAARAYIASHGYGEYFVHRTGHSIGTEVHGTGANMDNFETHDERRVVPRTCFSIEPGIYLPSFGIRSEVNMYVGEERALVTGAIQDRLVSIS